MSEIMKTSAPGALSERIQYAETLAESSLLPKQFQKQPANVLMAIEYGNSLELSPIQAIQEITVINGKPTASANLIGALVRKAGHRLRVKADTATKTAVAQITRHDDPEYVYEVRWDMERAKSAGLTGKDNWKNYPEAMLKARAITEVAREACPEALMGINYTREELEDSTGFVEAPITVDPAVTTSKATPAEDDTLALLADTTTPEEMTRLWDTLTPEQQGKHQAAFHAHAQDLAKND